MQKFENTNSNIDRLYRLQEGFCKILNVCAFCVDEDGHALTKLSGDKIKSREMMLKLPNDRLTIMLEYVMRSAVEDRLVEETEDGSIILGTLSVKINKKPVFSYIVFGESNKISEDRMYEALNFLHDTTKTLYDTSDNSAGDFKAVKAISNELDFSLKKSAAMQDIVRFLDSEDGIEKITDSILKIACDLLKISNAFLIKRGSVADVLGEYTMAGTKPVYESRRGVIVPNFISSIDNSIAISSKSNVDEKTKNELYSLGIRAVIINPVYVRDKHSMTCVFAHKIADHEWSVDEIRFLSDVSKILQNIINRKVRSNSLASSYASLVGILDHVGSGIFVRDLETGEVLFNNSTLRGYFERELREGSLGSYLDSYGIKVNENKEIYYESTRCWFDVQYTEMRWVDGREASIFALYDITDKKQYQRKIEHQAKNDFLTGLYNRMSCERDLKEHIENCMVNHTNGYVIYLDIDNFKKINDSLGHKYGDVLLKAVAHSMQRIDGLEEYCYRMGGDEFVIIVPDFLAHRIEDILDDLDKICSKPWYLKGADHYCTMSIGVASFPKDADTLDELIKKADGAMYAAKRAGKNRTIMYDESILTELGAEEE